MKQSTKLKKIKYYESLIHAKKRLLDSYYNNEYFRQDKNWSEKANKMIAKWENKIKEIEALPLFIPHRSYLTDKEYRKKYNQKYKNCEPVKEKQCSLCLVTKKAEEFNKNTASKTGLTSYCRSCYNEKYGWSVRDKDVYYEKYGKFSTREELNAYREKIHSKEYKRKRQDKFNKSWGSGVYLATSTGGTYVGFSTQLRARKIYHNSNSKRPDSPIAGIYELLDFKILEKTNDRSREQYWINKLKPTLNQRSGGAGRK